MKNMNNQKELPSLQKGLARGLEWLPNYEGVLLYDPEYIKEDRPVRRLRKGRGRYRLRECAIRQSAH